MNTHEPVRMFERWAYENIDAANAAISTQSRNNSDNKNQLHSPPQRLNLKRQRLPEYDDDNSSEYEEPKRITVTNLTNSHPNGWSPERHYGMCGQSCPCCRAHVDGNTIGACSICLLTFQTNGRLTEAYRSYSPSSTIRRTRSVSASIHLGIQNERFQP